MRIKDSSDAHGPIEAVTATQTLQWEYLVRIMPVRSADLMAPLGAEGWELVAVSPIPGDASRAVYHFKRPA